MAGRGLQPGDVLVVVHDFDARSGDELTLRRSERVELIELDDGFNDGWYLGKHLTRGGTGLFPGVYTTKAPAANRNPQPPVQPPTHLAASTTPPGSRPSMGSASLPGHAPTPAMALADPRADLPSDGARASLPAPHHTTYVHRTIGEALGEQDEGQDSPVLHETLNVIDEHITDLSTPRQSLGQPRHREDSESEYSSHLDRLSFLAGPETDEEDNAGLDEATVRSWDHNDTAQHLRSLGVDAKHCDIFLEQEISGDVLLDMDQNFIYMKEFDFGVMGRRLKTWHKIRDFQREVKSHAPAKRPSQHSLTRTPDETHRSYSAVPSIARAGTQSQYAGPISEEPDDMPQPLQPTQSSKRTSSTGVSPSTVRRAATGTDSPARANTTLSARSRRHSSIDFGAQPDLELSSLSTASHRKQPSIDRAWSMAGSTQATTPTSSSRPSGKLDEVLPLAAPPPRDQSPVDFDRGYFSGNDADNRKARNRLSKGPRPGHSRQTSLAESLSKRSSLVPRHTRISSAGPAVEDAAMSNAARAYNAQPKKGRFRSSSARTSANASPAIGTPPAVTNLENDSTPSIGSPVVEKMRMQDRARKLMGFRTTSDAVTSAEKTDAGKLTASLATVRSSEALTSPATGDTTPSATPSLDMDTPEGTDVASSLTKTSTRTRPKQKQYTSAYTHGLLKISPSDARKNCDHHGWMKKKSSGIMATWKPRLFVLRGRRLSYYYSELDTEERGIIDISGHKVLAANDDPMVTLHASVTGASKASSTPRSESEAASPVKPSPPMGVFYFKLVPPRTGLSRAVQFTKPAVHYFQVDTIVQGRKWMGEMMKATIEHDLLNFETTNKQKTISLAKARARKERPPALDDTKKVDDEEKEKAETEKAETEKAEKERALRESGLGIEFKDKGSPPAETKPAESPTQSPHAAPLVRPASRTSLEEHAANGEQEKGLPAVSGGEGNENEQVTESVPASEAAKD